jgi:NADH-quinone oxidoreductase subunit L
VNAAYVILALPLAGFLINLALGRKLGDPLAGWLATLASAGAFVASIVVWVSLLGRSGVDRSVDKNIFQWISVAGLHVNFAVRVDPLSVTMALFVTGVGSLIHLYSIGYMKGDPGFPRFFVYMNLFLFSMLSLVLADNFLFLFLGWEGVGFCSYGLVGFWFDRESAAVAAKKAFVTNRIGDVGFVLAIFVIFNHFSSLNFTQVLGGYQNGHPVGLLAGHPGAIPSTTATAITMLLLLGAVGKSAQLPLYMWLPDAMEGPTPVSALIHAATMVTAGVYLMSRVEPLLHYSRTCQWAVAIVGVSTLALAATIACVQDDIKRVLAYSTISQLGYMFLGVGSGSPTSGLFHMITHSFFKALLFLAAGSVIHGMHDDQDMKRMGGLLRYMKLTAVTFMIGWLTISGIPPLAGFWSKDDILAAAWHMNKGLWVVGALTAGLTAYYMSRQVALVFLGKARWKENRPAPAAVTVGQGSAPPGHDDVATGPGDVAAEHGEGEPHEPSWVMRFPLVVLAILCCIGGLVNLPYQPFNALDRFLAPVFPTQIVPAVYVPTDTKVVLSIVVVALAVIGIVFGLTAWRQAERPALEPAILRHGWYIDDTVSDVVSGPVQGGADVLAFDVDAKGIDGAVGAVTSFFTDGGGLLRRLQTGYVRNYALGIALGTAAILLYVAVRVGS